MTYSKCALFVALLSAIGYFVVINSSAILLPMLFIMMLIVSLLVSLRLASRSETRFKQRYQYLFVVLSALMTGAVLYGLLKSLNNPETISFLIGKIMIFISIPFIYQLMYKSILCIHYLLFRPKVPMNEPVDATELPSCSILIATRNEPFDVCKLTFDSANALIYQEDKKEIIVVDNSDLNHPDLAKWQSYVEEHAQSGSLTNYKFIHRQGTDGFKPKNLDIGMAHITKDHVLLLDADSTLKEDTLLKTMPEFVKDPSLGFASLLIKGTNQSCNFFAKIGCISQNMLRYSMSLIGQAGFVIFQGHNSIWSMQALQKVGNWLEEFRGEPMIVEDVAAAVRCYFKGSYGKTIWVESGEWVPTSLKECQSMWMRWTYGNMQITHKYIGKICRSRYISVKEKLDILNQMFSFSTVLTPFIALLSIFFPAQSGIWLSMLALSFIPSVLYAIGYGLKNKSKNNQSILRRVWELYLGFFVMNSFIIWVSMKAVYNYLMGISQGWKPTGKTAESAQSWTSVLISYKSILFYCAFAIGAFVTKTTLEIYNGHEMIVPLISQLGGLSFVLSLGLALPVFGQERMQEVEEINKMSIAFEDTLVGAR
ncbi:MULTISPECIES: glycosyltransferase [Cysteiniphilum]|uniref:glycosyltransferase n=1 Tax=Cysteiniphilum TaxID=2056696 RepID=UPI001783BBA5|nr:glycosyltransferase [Cysteiniphilum marinum]